MVKRILSILLVFSFIAFNFSKAIILLNYELNKKEITQKYCVNKDKPWMHCCGKCHLKKELTKDDAQQKAPNFPGAKYDIQLFGSSASVKINNIESDGITMISPYLKPLLCGVHTSVFHPPCA